MIGQHVDDFFLNNFFQLHSNLSKMWTQKLIENSEQKSTEFQIKTSIHTYS